MIENTGKAVEIKQQACLYFNWMGIVEEGNY